MEIKYVKDLENVRFLFEKLCSMPMKEKMAKLTFKKYLNFEIKYGTSKTQEKVKKMAMDYVNRNCEE